MRCRQHERFKKTGENNLPLLCNHTSEVPRLPGMDSGIRNERADYGRIKTAATRTVVHFPSAPQTADAER